MFDELIRSMRLFAEAVMDFMRSFLNAITELLPSVSKKYRRIRHLAFHSRKARVRKKNARRLFDTLFLR
ncbi:MAG: hypothetical protein K2O60_07645 [Ruminococcus sp.]|nr:hypothetical protein [Ruminococcus sp.]